MIKPKEKRGYCILPKVARTSRSLIEISDLLETLRKSLLRREIICVYEIS